MPAPTRKNPTRFVVSIDPEYTQTLQDRGIVIAKSDGRLEGISKAVNKSLEKMLWGEHQ